jgi:sporulation protein YlmC with PRC-barrel domain
MRANLIIAVSALGLLAGPAFAQTATPAPGGTMPRTTAPGAPVGAPMAAPRIPMLDPLTQEDTSQIKGSVVYGSDDKRIGSVSAVLMKPDSKTLDRLVVSEGGVLGVGSHRVALPIDDFKWDGDRDAFKIGETTDELKAMPAWIAASASTATEPSSGSAQSPLSAVPAGGLSAPGKAQSSTGADSTDE